jgi:nucleoside-diphosphate-sugar epimerase
MSRVLITGATGFIGRALCADLQSRGRNFRATLGRADSRGLLPPEADCVTIGRLEENPDWRHALSGCDTVVHLAGRAHRMADPPQEDGPYLTANVAPSESLAREAVRCGVRRIVFASTAKVFGEGRDEPYREQDPAQPTDSYSRSKWLAEQRLADIARAGGVELVVLRIPLVYGAGVAGNFAALIDAVRRGSWMPLGGIQNRRSLIYRGNLVDLIIRCLDHPAACGRTLPVSESDDVSTPELIRRIAQAAGCRANLLPLPPGLLRIAGRLSGRSRQIERLLGSLTLDPTPLNRDLDWSPPFTMQTGLLETITGASVEAPSSLHQGPETPT